MPRSLGQTLVEAGYLEPDQLATLEARVGRGNPEIADALYNLEEIDSTIVLRAYSEVVGVQCTEIDPYSIDPAIIEIIPENVARELTAIALFDIADRLTVAMHDPADIMAIDRLREETGREIIAVLANRREIEKAISLYYDVESKLESLVRTVGQGAGEDEIARAEDENEISLEELLVDSSPLVQIVNLIILQAVRMGSSDIHIEPDDGGMRVRYRTNGVLSQKFELPLSVHPAAISRLKVLAHMDLAQRRIPQDGRISVVADRRRIDLRVSSLPTIKGEKIVIRLLDKNASMVGLGELGLSSDLEARWRELISQPNGIILVTGPTGSGKTTSLYASLAEINKLDKNIVTVEDPVEYDFPIINQVQVNAKAGLTFAAALRSILRQDPNVVMLGEIRDRETASIAVRAALTGHLVLSTLHTNDAASAVTRLIDMGVEPYLLASALRGVLAQRLVRSICPSCAVPAKLQSEHFPAEFLARVREAGIQPKTGKGCRRCNGTGFKGRVALCEMLYVNDEIERGIVRELPASEIKLIAKRHGMVELFEEGLEKVRAGITNLEELLLATTVPEEELSPPPLEPIDESGPIIDAVLSVTPPVLPS